jgi:hypothetical protein
MQTDPNRELEQLQYWQQQEKRKEILNNVEWYLLLRRILSPGSLLVHHQGPGVDDVKHFLRQSDDE